MGRVATPDKPINGSRVHAQLPWRDLKQHSCGGQSSADAEAGGMQEETEKFLRGSQELKCTQMILVEFGSRLRIIPAVDRTTQPAAGYLGREGLPTCGFCRTCWAGAQT